MNIRASITHTFPDKTVFVDCIYCDGTGKNPLVIWLPLDYDRPYIHKVNDEVCPVCRGLARLHVYPSSTADPWTPCQFCDGWGRETKPVRRGSENYFTCTPCRLCNGLGFTFFSKKDPLVDPGYTGETTRLHPLD